MTLYNVVMEILGYFAVFFDFLCGKVTVNPEKNRKTITRTVGILAAAETFATTIAPDIVRMELDFLQKRWGYICLFIVLTAVIPPFMAVLDKRKSGMSVRKGYAGKNLLYNIFGAVCVVMMVFIAHYEIQDFRFLEDFRLDSIFKILLPICLWIALSYQSLEQQSSKIDHDASLKWRNQRCNVLYLFTVYFWAFFSTVLVIAYTIYCYIHNVQIKMNLWYLVFLSLVLIFFYGCAFNEQEHVRFVFVVDVPIILICSIYWMSWFVFDDVMILAQFIFILVHSLVYTTIIYVNAGVVAKSEPGGRRDKEYKVYFKKFPLKIKSWFHVITFFLIIVAYMTFWVIPNAMQTERIESTVAEACIGKICADTDTDAEALLEEMRDCPWYDDEKQDMDRTQFLIFVYDRLWQEMVDKGVIRETDRSVSYEELIEWSVKAP